MPQYGDRVGCGRMRPLYGIPYLPKVIFQVHCGIPLKNLEEMAISHEKLKAIWIESGYLFSRQGKRYN